MTERDLIAYCSPTLASLKTANMFNPAYSSEEELNKQLTYWNRALGEKGVSVRILRRRKGRVLLYVYRRSRLESDLGKSEVIRFLSQCGYQDFGLEELLERLTLRMQEMDGFPHEIGVFLGYPLEDVIGFIENEGRNSKCSGYWKVYGDEQEAKKSFRRFRKCFRIYEKLWAEGKTVWQLTVAA